MGVGDDLPASNEFIDCKSLTFEAIWLLNRINTYLETNGMTLEEMVGDHICTIQVETVDGQETIEYIH